MTDSNRAMFDFFPDNEILSHAKEFLNLCKELQGKWRFTIPFIINATFAIELSLKCLHANQYYDNNTGTSYSKSLLKSRNHSPHELYDIFPDEKKLWLNDLHSEFFHDRKTKLRQELEFFEKVFINWRYMYEGNSSSIRLDILKDLLRFFEFACSPESISKYRPKNI